jgi:hypothetical protein
VLFRSKTQYGFELAVGTKVYIYNPRDTLLKRRTQVKPYVGTIEGMVGSIYLVRTPSGIEKCSRSQLKPVE